jgi:hypothetical protein
MENRLAYNPKHQATSVSFFKVFANGAQNVYVQEAQIDYKREPKRCSSDVC